MKTSITSLEISKLFNIPHKSITKTIRGCKHKGMFSEDSWISQQNKPLTCFEMGNNGLSWLLAKPSFSRGDRLSIKTKLFNDFGLDTLVVVCKDIRGEDEFYKMLVEFLPNQEIIREYGIADCRVDFYLPDHYLIIEFDEGHHDYTKVADAKREEVIKTFVMEEFDEEQVFIRVDAGSEISGLSKIIGYIALSSHNAVAVTSLYELS